MGGYFSLVSTENHASLHHSVSQRFKTIVLPCCSHHRTMSTRGEKTRGNASTQPWSRPIKKMLKFKDRMGLRLGKGISPSFFAFLRDPDGVGQAIPKSFLFFRENFLLLVCGLMEGHGGSSGGSDHQSWGWKFTGPQSRKDEVVKNITDFLEGFTYHLN